MTKKEYSEVAKIWATLNAAAGVFEILESKKLIYEDYLSRRFFPKGGLPLLKEEILSAYQTAQKLIINHKKNKESGMIDLNYRPLGSKPSALAKLS